jgi:ABC-type maltose transport system permease subunit
MATSVIIALPSLVMFSFAQNYFINNMAGGMKE